MRSWLFLALGAGLVAIYGCSGGGTVFGSNGGSTTGTASNGSTGTATGTSNGGASTTTTTGTNTGGATTTTTTTGTSTGGSTTTTTTTMPAPCPKVTGHYTMTKMGLGCGDLAVDVQECIKETPNQCSVLFVSKPGAVLSFGIDGTVMIDMNGDFMNGALKEGTVMRTGCVGKWMPGTPNQMVVDCGGMGTTQSCVVTLTHVGDVCPF